MTGADDEIEAVAETLAFDLTASECAECLETAEGLSASADAIVDGTEEGVPTRGRLLDDEHGALLSGYEEPRTRSSSGPLTSYQVAIKDNIALANVQMTVGSEHFEHVPSFDAAVVDRLLDAGARIVGKANMDAFAFGPSGEFSGRSPVENPLDSERVPGGSSSGSGVAVAAGDVDIALGTDTGGSVRIPAACCGVVGIKPTYGTVPNHGVVPFAPSLDTVGPLARDVETAATALDVLRDEELPAVDTGPRPDDESVSLGIGVPSSLVDVCDDRVTDVLVELRDTLPEELNTSDVDLPLGGVEDAYPLIGSTEFAWYVRQGGTVRGLGSTYDQRWGAYLREFIETGSFSDHVAKRVLPAAYLDAREEGSPYAAARREADAFAQRVEEALSTVDVLMLPTIRTLPHERGEITASEGMFDLLGNTAPFNLSGHPAVTLPVDSVGGLPVSVQFVAPRGEDQTAVRAAATMERVIESGALSPPRPGED